MLAMPTRTITAATERTLFPKVPEPITLSRRPRTKRTRDTTQAGQDNEPNHGQWQPDLHASENGSGAAKGYIKHEAPGDDLNHGQSQKALHNSDNGSGAAKGHVKHEAPGDDLNHGQSQKTLHDSEERLWSCPRGISSMRPRETI